MMMKLKNLLTVVMLFGLVFSIKAQDEPVYRSKTQIARHINSAGDGLKNGGPDVFDIDAQKLNEGIAEIINQAIDSMAFPGAQVLIAKNGLVFYHQGFGYQTYNKVNPIDTTDIYDLASVTKTTASTLALMKLYDLGLFDPDKTMGDYFPKVAK
ncbi:MAG: CubicO group peptidase (beta-lactamase class C family), partial [Nonlabens sp.]